MKKSGEITVFLSMILLCVASLICVMLESARTAGSRWMLQVAAGSSLDSLFSEYHRQLWQEYHLLGLEFQSEEELEEGFLAYLEAGLQVENWYPMKAERAEVRAVKGLTEDGGLWLEREILDYMKYGVWSRLDIRPEDGERLWTDIRQSAGMETVTSAYGKQSEAAWELEMALEKIYLNLNRQGECHRQGAGQLAEANAGGFYQTAKQLEKEIGALPGLVKRYEVQADRLYREIGEMEQTFQQQDGELREDMKTALGKELEQYRTYVAADGERRRELAGLPAVGEGNRLLVSEARQQVEQIEAYVDALKDGEEDQSAAMWDAARTRWSQFQGKEPVEVGRKDKEKRAWLLKLQQMAEHGLLELVIPPGHEVSEAVFPLQGLPSDGKAGGGETDQRNWIRRVLVNEYCAMHMKNYCSQEEGMGQQYGMEYLLGGKGSDRENLADTVKKLLLLREGMNLMHLFSDSQKREEARGLALAITGALGLTPLVEITALFILGIWALGESIMDIRTMLSGGKVPLLKRKEEWILGLEQLLDMGKNQTVPGEKPSESGLSYEGYLKLLLLAEESERKYYRMMDVIQMNLQREQVDFRLEHCAYRVDMEVGVCGKHVFFALPFVENLTGSKEHGYGMRVSVEKAY